MTDLKARVLFDGVLDERERHGERLSAREREVSYRRVVLGEANAQVAAALGISVKTVEVYVDRLVSKLRFRGARDAHEALLEDYAALATTQNLPRRPFEVAERTKGPKDRVPTLLRWQVWERDDFRCAQCGGRIDLTVDHIVPESAGGLTTLSNLQTLCRSCNSRKGARVDEITTLSGSASAP